VNVADVNAGIQGRRRGLVIRRSSRTDSRLPTPFARRRGDAIPWRRFARLSTVAMSRRYPRRVRAQLTAPNRPFALRAGRAASPALAVPPPAAASAARAAPACRGSPRSSSRAVPGALRSAHARPRSARRVRRVTAPGARSTAWSARLLVDRWITLQSCQMLLDASDVGVDLRQPASGGSRRKVLASFTLPRRTKRRLLLAPNAGYRVDQCRSENHRRSATCAMRCGNMTSESGRSAPTTTTAATSRRRTSRPRTSNSPTRRRNACGAARRRLPLPGAREHTALPTAADEVAVGPA
jgi:hypothetical protein